jgi:uncharacterized protein YegJ (DUF2314 family)
MLWLFLALLATLAIIGVLLMRRRPSSRAGAGNDLVSIVLLRQSPRTLSEADVRGILRRVNAPPAELMPLPPVAPHISGFAVLHNGTPMFYFVSAARPYCENPTQEAMKFEDPRGRKAFADHTAWVSIDAVGGMPPKNVREQVLKVMSRIAAELMDHESTLVYSTWLGRVALPGAEAERTLRSDTPLSLFQSDDELNAPIIHTGKGDEAINQAMAEAQRNYPTLLAAWNRAGAASDAIAKGRFVHNGQTEFMWIKIASISDTVITGELGNEPVHIPGLTKGQTVSVPHADVVDWACIVDGKPQGMYVEKLLMLKNRK